MVRHWWQVRKENKNWIKKISINGIGLFLTSLILVSVLSIKFFEGGWITILITGSLIILALITKKHYNSVNLKIKELDETILPAITESIEVFHNSEHSKQEYNVNNKTAIIFVNGFNGLGIHTLLSVIRTFPNTFSNFAFAQVGVVDTGSFKGTAELIELESKTKKDIYNYIEFINRNGFYAEGFSKVGTEVIETAEELLMEIQTKFSNAVYFGGQLVFHKETIFNKMLHNQIVFTLQKKLYKMGLPFVIMPIKINM